MAQPKKRQKLHSKTAHTCTSSSHSITLCLWVLAFIIMNAGMTKAQTNEHKAKLPTRELRELSNTIKASEIYVKEKQKTLDLLTDSMRRAKGDEATFRYSLRLSGAYRSFNTDSALKYAGISTSLAEHLSLDHRREADIVMVEAYATAGIFTAAVSLFEKINPGELPMTLKNKYWRAGRMLYGYMKSYVTTYHYFEQLYTERYNQYDDSLLKYLPKDDKLRMFIHCERLVNEGEYKEAQDHLTQLMSILPKESNHYAMAAYQLAEVYRNYGAHFKYAHFLAESAISDVKGGIREGLALPTLAKWLYENGDFEDAFAYINFALEEVASGNVRMRAVTVSQLVPMIDDAYKEKISSSRDELMVYFILVSFLLILSGGLLTVLVRQIKKTRANQIKLKQITERQESYIGNFIGLYSSYADRLTRLTQLVSMKLASGQTSELQKLINSGKFTDQDSADVHKIFDQAFLDIYPDFVGELNQLLKEEEQISLKDPHSLTPELRVYAFVRLGVDESTRIAQILHYSSNTIYAYRNRMRNRAINRDTFDKDVMEIGKN